MALKQIKISVDEPLLPKGKNITHTATSYVIGKSMDLDDRENVIEEALEDTSNLTTKYFDVDIEYDGIIFVRCKYHFEINGVPHESNWSRVVPVNSLQTGIKLSSSIVKTPRIDVSEDDGMIHIGTSDFGMYTGPGTHVSTDYLITDSDGEVVFERENDYNNLTSIMIQDNLQDGKVYVVSARHTNSTNNTSYYGKQLFMNYSPYNELFSFEAPEEFVINRKFYYRLKLWVAKFKSYDLEIRKSGTNDAILSLKEETRTTNFLWLASHEEVNARNVRFLIDSGVQPGVDEELSGEESESREEESESTESETDVETNHVEYKPLFEENVVYDIFIKINFQDGTSTDFKKVYTAALNSNKIYNFDPSVKYCDKYDIGKPKNTEGITCSIIRETFDNKFIGVDFKTNSLKIFKLTSDNELFPLAEAYKFNRNLDVDYINVVQLPNHDVLVDIVMYTEKKQARTMFLLFEYDPIKLQLNLLKQKIRYDERYTTSVSNSLVVTNAGEVYYIPSYLTNNRNNDRDWLKLRKLDTETLHIEDIPLPYDVKYFANIILDKHDTPYVFGGSYTNYYEQDEDSNAVETWEVNERQVFRLDKSNNTFELWSELPEYFPKELYCVQPFRRKDGLNILFNATWSGKALEFDKFITFEPVSKTFNETDINGQVRVPLRSAYVFNIGDIYRFTAKATDPQSTLIYNSNTNVPENIPDFNDIDKENITLEVNDGEVVTIEDIYKYSTITINGTGLVKWYRPQGITVLNSKTLIINRDTVMAQSTLATRKFEQILVLDGCEFRINTQGTAKVEKEPVKQ